MKNSLILLIFGFISCYSQNYGYVNRPAVSDSSGEIIFINKVGSWKISEYLFKSDSGRSLVTRFGYDYMMFPINSQPYSVVGADPHGYMYSYNKDYLLNSSMVTNALGYTPLNILDTLQYNNRLISKLNIVDTLKYDNRLNSKLSKIDTINYNNRIVSKQNQLNGTGFIKASGTTISYDNSTYLTSNQSITLSGDISGTGTTAITTTLANSGVTSGTYDKVTVNSKGIVTSGSNMNIPSTMTSKTIGTAYQISTTDDYEISVSGSVSCNLSLAGGQDGSLILEISPNGSTGWIYIGQIDGSNTGTLTIGLNTTQRSGGSITTALPRGYYWRFRSVNNTGTPTFSWLGGSQVLR